MKETKPTKLKKIHYKDKNVFLDTVVFGVVFENNQTNNQLKEYKKEVRK
jgi:hypothetical protein